MRIQSPLPSTIHWRSGIALIFAMVMSLHPAGESTALAEQPYKIVYADPLEEPWRISRFSELDGRGLRCLIEDQAGNIWFGLRDGVLKYDGYHWVHQGKQHGLPGTDVYSLAIRSDGTLVAATVDGLYQQNNSSWTPIFPLTRGSGIRLTHVIETDDQSLWACCSWGLVHLSDGEATLLTSENYANAMPPGHPYDRIVVLPSACLPTEKLYSGTGVFLNANIVVALSDDSPARAAGLQLGDKIISVNGNEKEMGRALDQSAGVDLVLRVSRPVSGKVDSLSFSTTEVAGRFQKPAMNSLMSDRQGRLWAGVSKGRLIMSPDGGETWRTWPKSELLTGGHPAATETSDGSIWVFSSGRQRNVSRYVGEKWHTVGLAIHGGNSFNASAVESGDGTLWVGGLNKLHMYRNGSWSKRDTRDVKLPSEGHRMLVASDGALWICGVDQSVARISVSADEFASLKNLQYRWTEPSGTQWFVNTVLKLVVRKEGPQMTSFDASDGMIDDPNGIVATPAGRVIAIGSHQGIAAVAIYDGDRWRQKSFPKFARAFSGRGFCVASDGRLWIGAKGDRSDGQLGGVVVGNGDQWEQFSPPQVPPYCTSITEMDDGRMILGGGFGLSSFDGENSTAIRNSHIQADIACPGVTKSPDGTLWATTRTIGVLRCKDDQWELLDENDGLLANEASAIHADADGRVWVSTRDGLCRFDGERFHAIDVPPHLGRSLISSDDSGGIWLDGVLRFRVDANPPRAILPRSQATVESEALVSWRGIDKWNRTPADRLRWEWQLDGGPWIDSGSQTQVALSGLSPGDHAFVVRAMDGDANRSAPSISTTISVLPPFWLRPWFLIPAACLLGMLVWLSIRLIERGIALRESNRALTVAQQQLADQFAEKSAQFRAVCDCSPVGIFVTNPENTITYFNNYLAEVSGVSLDESLDESWRDAIHPADRDRVVATWQEAVHNGAPFRSSGRFLRSDGSIRWFEVAAARIDRDDQYLGYVGALEDVSDKINASEELTATNSRLRGALEKLHLAQDHAIKRERLNALGQMAAGVAHDINNSLTPLLTYAEMLENQAGLTGEYRQWLELICLGVRDTSVTVKRLEHFYRETHNRRFLDSVDVAQISTQTVDLTRPRWQDDARASGKQIDVSVDIVSRPIIKGNASQLRSVLTNLIFNSVDSISESGSVTIRINGDDSHAIVEVIDTGKGMNIEQRNRCMEPFFTSKANGSGLGLSECHGIVRQHGGDIELDSTDVSGTTIRFRIPRELPVKDVAATQPEAAGTSTTVATTPTQPAASPRRVLCIDDNEVVLASTVALLRSFDVEVATAPDGPSALSLMEKEDFQLVLCDQGLPGMDGLTVLKHIKSRWRNIPVVMVSGWTLPETEGATQPDGFIEKPFVISDLKQVLSTYIDISQMV